MSPEFHVAVKETLLHPKCKGLTFWPTSEGRWLVSIAWTNKSTWIENSDPNPLMALYKTLAEFERRINDEALDA